MKLAQSKESDRYFTASVPVYLRIVCHIFPRERGILRVQELRPLIAELRDLGRVDSSVYDDDLKLTVNLTESHSDSPLTLP